MCGNAYVVQHLAYRNLNVKVAEIPSLVLAFRLDSQRAKLVYPLAENVVVKGLAKYYSGALLACLCFHKIVLVARRYYYYGLSADVAVSYCLAERGSIVGRHTHIHYYNVGQAVLDSFENLFAVPCEICFSSLESCVIRIFSSDISTLLSQVSVKHFTTICAHFQQFARRFVQFRIHN